MSGFRLESCVWELTLACCFGCRYCGSAGGRARADELSTAECLDAAEQLADLGCRRVSLIGGEVFLRRDWAQIAGRLTGLGVRVDVITNGYLMSPEVLEQLKQAGVSSVAVSIDGPEDVHDAGRQAGSFKRAMEAVHPAAGLHGAVGGAIPGAGGVRHCRVAAAGVLAYGQRRPGAGLAHRPGGGHRFRDAAPGGSAVYAGGGRQRGVFYG